MDSKALGKLYPLKVLFVQLEDSFHDWRSLTTGSALCRSISSSPWLSNSNPHPPHPDANEATQPQLPVVWEKGCERQPLPCWQGQAGKVCRPITLGGLGIQNLQRGWACPSMLARCGFRGPTRRVLGSTYISFLNLTSTLSSKPRHPGPWATTVLAVFGAITELFANESWR